MADEKCQICGEWRSVVEVVGKHMGYNVTGSHYHTWESASTRQPSAPPQPARCICGKPDEPGKHTPIACFSQAERAAGDPGVEAQGCTCGGVLCAYCEAGKDAAYAAAKREGMKEAARLEKWVEKITECPKHNCEFFTNPEKGACDFHEFWAALTKERENG